jgi:hypothetical protein
LESQALLDEISEYCRRHGMAESTFGRLAINDGKLMNRLRTGGRVTHETLARMQEFMRTVESPLRRKPSSLVNGHDRVERLASAPREAEAKFRLYDNRQKYLLFVTTCSEKWLVSDRVSRDLAHIHPQPPAVRVFDAGVGDGTILARVMRAMHHRFPTVPFYVVGKEISLEDVRLTLEKVPDRFFEHPATCLVMTNMNYSEAPWLTPRSVAAATGMVWHELALTGDTAHDFEQQIAELQTFLSENWRASISPRSGNPVYEKPVVLVIYRNDYKFLLDGVRPRQGGTRADYDLVIASQSYRARSSLDFRARRVIAPLTRALGPGGRLLGFQSHGHDPGMEIVQTFWPDDNPFTVDRHDLLRAVRDELGKEARDVTFHASADARSLFRYDMHTLPNEISSRMGTSTLLAAWNAATFVAQIDDDRLAAAMANDAYLEATQNVVQKHGGLWFWDESFVISRRQDLL